MTQGRLTDYYALLGVDHDATSEELTSRIKQELRIWQKRTNNPDLTRRQEAEQKVKQLSEARQVLLDDDQRRVYDQRLAAQGAAPSATPTVADGSDWLRKAKEFLAVNDYLSASYAAREARQNYGESAEVWSLQARASTGLGRDEDALFEARQAVNLSPDDPDLRFDLALVHERLGQWGDAYGCYEALQRMDPTDEYTTIGMASCLIAMDQPDRAVPILEPLAESGREREMAGRYLAMALIRMAELMPRLSDGDTYVVTGQHEINQMRSLVERARQVSADRDIQAEVTRLTEYLSWCQSKHRVYDLRYSVIFKRAVIIVVGWIVLSLADQGVAVLIALVAAALWIGLPIYQCYKPGWKINQMSRDESGRAGAA
ncbi:hypothetical protein ALI144C_51710 [Actinosynnema sp. ALI-1.44]|uniref:DnaJ domain-containing protein n=1 Tax=Actinosynnema sp. ALI-1.44 TaxID=1933779 RepID=UPI0009D325FE|nr:DnaJ domain-containing protein [Actinosynnema sp. ALI-1.44]ONI71032.1 hypothetical protein ALI144C_51710 [Actinosynnema sp. ALI-1.44]